MVFQITGIFEDIPGNSHIKFDIVLPWSNLLDILGTDFDDSWGDSGAFTYILFKKGVNISEFQKKLDAHYLVAFYPAPVAGDCGCRTYHQFPDYKGCQNKSGG